MIDSGATNTFISRRFIKENHVVTRKLKHPILLFNIDGTENKDGSISEIAILQMQIGDHMEKVAFSVTDIGSEDLIIGLDWLRTHNPDINWETGLLKLSRCTDRCRAATKTILKKEPEVLLTRKQKRQARPKGKVVGKVMDRDEEFKEEMEGWNETTDAEFLRAGTTWTRKQEDQSLGKTNKVTVEDYVPEQYCEFLDVFSEEKSHRLPERRPYDHAIDLIPDAKLTHSKTYHLSYDEGKELDKFIDENLARGYIRESKSPMSSPFFFVSKKNGKLRPTQDYRKLNDITIKNRYPLPLISEIVDSAQNFKYFTALDLRWGYNNVRIKEGDEWKAAFTTKRGLFEPLVMFFGLTNSPATFQAMMNHLFADLIVTGKVRVYLDDILICSLTLEKHRTLVKEVLKRLRENDLYLNPEKCQFEQTRITHLGVILSQNKVEMDPTKVNAIINWPTPTNASHVRKFRGFANFYRRFIQDFCIYRGDQRQDYRDECEQDLDVMLHLSAHIPDRDRVSNLVRHANLQNLAAVLEVRTLEPFPVHLLLACLFPSIP